MRCARVWDGDKHTVPTLNHSCRGEAIRRTQENEMGVSPSLLPPRRTEAVDSLCKSADSPDTQSRSSVLKEEGHVSRSQGKAGVPGAEDTGASRHRLRGARQV